MQKQILEIATQKPKEAKKAPKPVKVSEVVDVPVLVDEVEVEQSEINIESDEDQV